MSRRRERSRSPVDRRERDKPDRDRHERNERPSSHHRNKDHFHNGPHKEQRDDRPYHRQDQDNRERRRSPDRRPPHREGDNRGEDNRRTRNVDYGDNRGRRRDEARDFREDRNRNDDKRDNRRPPFNRRDRRREREEEEPEDTSRYGQPADGGDNTDNTAAVDPEQPNFGLSGKLTEYTNTYKGVVIKYNEPPEARKPKTRWRLYPFKGEESLPVLYIHRQSAFLMGRQRHIADIPIDHPSCSKQHAVLQYKLADFERPDGRMGKKVKPYIIDLESANGTFLNNEKIEPRRYYELKERDVLKFGFSSREYVMLNESSLNTEGNQEGSKASSEEEASPE